MKEEMKAINRKVYCSSIMFGKEFGISHKHIMEKIRNFTVELSTMKKEFKISKYTNERKREYDCYYMTEKGFMFLVMQTGGKGTNKNKIYEIQCEFVDKFVETKKVLITILGNNSIKGYEGF